MLIRELVFFISGFRRLISFLIYRPATVLLPASIGNVYSHQTHQKLKYNYAVEYSTKKYTGSAPKKYIALFFA